MVRVQPVWPRPRPRPTGRPRQRESVLRRTHWARIHLGSTARRHFVGCVRVQQDEYHTSPRGSHHEAVKDAQRLASMLHHERVNEGVA